jgi:hypothetical protein
VDNEDLMEAVNVGGNYYAKSIGDRKVICFRLNGYEITTDYSSDHEAYESVITLMDDGAVLYSVMHDYQKGSFNLAVKWLGKELDPQLSFLEE